MAAKTPNDPFGEGLEAAKARRNRSMAIAAGLVVFIAVVFVITIVRLMGNVGR